MRVRSGLSAAVLAGILLSGCGGGDGADSPSSPQGNVELVERLVALGMQVDLPAKALPFRKVEMPLTLTGSIKDTVSIEDYIFDVPACTLKVRTRHSPSASVSYSWENLRAALLNGWSIRDSSSLGGKGYNFRISRSDGFSGQASLVSATNKAYGMAVACQTENARQQAYIPSILASVVFDQR